MCITVNTTIFKSESGQSIVWSIVAVLISGILAVVEINDRFYPKPHIHISHSKKSIFIIHSLDNFAEVKFKMLIANDGKGHEVIDDMQTALYMKLDSTWESFTEKRFTALSTAGDTLDYIAIGKDSYQNISFNALYRWSPEVDGITKKRGVDWRVEVVFTGKDNRKYVGKFCGNVRKIDSVSIRLNSKCKE